MEEQQFDKCLEELRKVIFAQCFKMLSNHEDAQDATQDTFRNAWANRDKYTPRPGTDFENWVRRIATNACRDVLRKRKTRPPGASDTDVTHNSDLHPTTDIWSTVVTNEMLASLKTCLEARDFWMLKLKLNQFTLNEIVAELPEPWRLTSEGVKSRFDRQIKRCLEETKKKFEQMP